MKILAGFIEDGRHSGIDKYLLNFREEAAKRGVTVDFLTSVPDEALIARLAEKGSRVFTVPNLRQGKEQEKEVCRLLKEGGYDLYYHNVSEPLNLQAARAAKKCGVKCFLHSHSSGMDREGKAERLLRGAVNSYYRHKLWKCGDGFFTCSPEAALWLYPEKIARRAKVIYNAVSFEKFAFSPADRARLRAEWGAGEEETILFFAGNFSYVKNTLFLPEVLKEILKERNARLVLAGTGAYRERLEEKIARMGLGERVCFLGVRDDMPALFSAADLFLLPSLFEGLPVTLIEAQASGLPALAGVSVTRLADVSGRVRFLDFSPSLWAKEAKALLAAGRREADISPEFREKFDLSHQKKQWFTEFFNEK